jgi:DNA-binding NarL/FixJ family response regulator
MILSRSGSSQVAKRVMIADDHAVVRKGLRALIEGMGGWEVCAEAADGIETVAIAAETRPDVVIMDLAMPGLGGIDAMIQIRKVLPQVEVLVLTVHESDRIAGQALRGGARGYLLKRESVEKLRSALEALSRHQPYFSPLVSETLLSDYVNSEISQDITHLTPRERQIVKLVAEGKSNKGIARDLSISVKTVETHRAAAMHKVGATTAAELTLYAARNDLVQL